MIIKQSFLNKLVLFILHFTIAAFIFGQTAPGKKRKTKKAYVGAPKIQLKMRINEWKLTGSRYKQAWIRQEKNLVYADRIFWNEKTEVGRCFGRVRVIDPVSDVLITGGAAWHYAKRGYSVVKRKPVLYLKKNDITVYAREMHRYIRTGIAKAIGRVIIKTKEGTAKGKKALYDTKRKVITLTGDPVLEQKKDVHRAKKIVFYMEEDKVVFIDEAKLQSGRDYVLADKIVVYDLEKKSNDKNNKKKDGKTSGKKNQKINDKILQTDKDKKKKRKDRKAYYYGHVRMYQFSKEDKLEAITTGGYAEYDNITQYAKVLDKPKLIMVSDNTIITSSVMEQFQKEKRAVAKGRVKIIKGHRAVSSELADYFLDEKKIYLTGNPVITEWGDKYRADVVVFDIKNDKIKWFGRSIAIIGTDDEGQKRKEWDKKYGGRSFIPGKTQPSALFTSIIGEVFLSVTGKTSTNDNQIIYGKRVARKERVADKIHIIVPDDYSVCEMKLYNRSMLRFKGFAHLKLDKMAFRSVLISTNKTLKDKKNDKKTEKKDKEMKSSLKEKKNKTDIKSSLKNDKTIKKNKDPKDMSANSSSSLKASITKLTIKQGVVLIKIAKKQPQDIFEVRSSEAVISNFNFPLRVSSVTNQSTTFMILSTSVTSVMPKIYLEFKSLKNFNFGTNDSKRFYNDISPYLTKQFKEGWFFEINKEKYGKLDNELETYITNFVSVKKAEYEKKKKEELKKKKKSSDQSKTAKPENKKSLKNKKSSIMAVKYTDVLRKKMLGIFKKYGNIIFRRRINRNDLRIKESIKDFKKLEFYKGYKYKKTDKKLKNDLNKVKTKIKTLKDSSKKDKK